MVDGALGAPFVWPLVANAAQSPGGVYVKVPMPYRTSMRISVAANLEYYHVDYRQFATADGVTTFSPADPALDVLATLRAAGTVDPKPAAPTAVQTSGTVDVPAGAAVTIAESARPGMISALHLWLPEPADQLLTGLRRQIDFDGQTTVDSPLGEFFGAGLGSTSVRSLMFAAVPQPGGSLALSAWWPMPFARTARVSLVNTTDSPARGVAGDVVIAPDPRWAPDALRFGIEHGKLNMVEPDYSSTAFLYTRPDDTATVSDDVNPTDPANRLAHGYTDDPATEQLLVSQYEGSDDARPVIGLVSSTAAAIMFDVALRPDNGGVLLHRTSDQAVGFQSADVAIDGVPAGNWRQPRSNTFHRWLDDTYLVPEALTTGKARIAVTLTPTADSPPWTASRYQIATLTGPSAVSAQRAAGPDRRKDPTPAPST